MMLRIMSAGFLVVVLLSGGAEAVQCPSFPNPLNNNTTADATAVMNDFYYLQSCPALGTNPTFTGYVGIGTTSPSNPLTVSSAGPNAIAVISSNTNSTGIAINNNSSGGHSWDLASSGGGPASAGDFVFYDNTSGGSRVTIDTSGNVGVATTTPGNKLEVAGGISIVTAGNYDSNPGLHLFYDGSANSYIFSIQSGVAWKNLTLAGLTVTTINESDRRMKTKIQDLSPTLGLAGIARLRPVTFHWLDREQDKQNGQQVGLIAQEVEPVFPYLVKTTETNSVITLPDGSKKPVDHVKALNYNGLVVPLVEAVKELKALFDTDHSEIVRLRAANDDLAESVRDLRQAFEDYKNAHTDNLSHVAADRR